MRLEKFEINGINCLNIPKLDQSNVPEDGWTRFGYEIKPIDTAILRIGEKLENMIVKLNDDFTDSAYLYIVRPDGNYVGDYELYPGENTFNFSDYSSNDSEVYHVVITVQSSDGINNLYWIEVHGGTGFTLSKDASKYFESVKIGGNEFVNKIVNNTVDIEDYIRGIDVYPGSNHIFKLSEQLTGFELYVKDEYKNHYITLINAYYDYPYDPYFEDYTDNSDYDEWELPYNTDIAEGITFVISSVPFEQLQSDSSLLDSEFVVAYGLTFVIDAANPDIIDDHEEWGETGQLVDPNSTQSVRVLDGTTLGEYSVVPDIYNVKINKSINGPHTLTFNLQPYTNASNIYTPRILEIDNDFYIVQQIKKRRQIGSLEMDIYSEHVSYELNQPPSEFFDDEQGKFVWTEDTYEGDVFSVLEEMLSYHDRFYIKEIDSKLNRRSYTFKTSAEGFRSRINEFAHFIGAEVVWKKFAVSLVSPIVKNSGLRLEVGKNIIGLTEIIDSTRHGRTTRSYEVDVVDLHHIHDELENPLELMDIRLGDIVTLIDNQYGINRTDRIVSIEYDPFKKSLPIIELENNVKSFTNSDDSNSGASAPKMSIDYVIETAREFYSHGMFFEFTRPYTEVFSVTVSLSTQYGRIAAVRTVSTMSEDNEMYIPPNAYYELVYSRSDGGYVGVQVYGQGYINQDIEVSIQAICDPFAEEIRYE